MQKLIYPTQLRLPLLALVVEDLVAVALLWYLVGGSWTR
jgi:hypothetical protein